MLDSCTSAMCTDSWGRSSYARSMVELRADVELKDTLVVAISKFMGEGYSMSTIRVEYEWTPPKCSSYKNGASSNGTKKQGGLARQEVSTSNPFDALNTVEKDDELGTNGGKSKLVEKGAKSDVGGQLEDSDDEIEELDDDTTRYMSFTDRAGGGENDAGLVEDEVFDCYDGYEDQV
ncbi:hypothetical protein Tco_0960715 [Tanacetum coccineum]